MDASSADAGGTPDALSGDGGNDLDGGDAGGAGDAGFSDGGVGLDGAIDDGGMPDAGPGPITARALDVDGNPLAGVNVAFSTQDGTLISTATTTASGEVTETVPANAIISFGYSSPQANSTSGSYLVQVINGVQPGDTIEANMSDAFSESASQPLGTASLMFPTLHAGASSYTVGTRCDSTWQGVSQTYTKTFETDRCSGDTTTLDLLGIAWSASNTPMAWTMFDDVQIGTATTFYSTGWNTNFGQFNAFYTDAPFDGDINLTVRILRDAIDYGFGGFLGSTSVTSGGNAAYAVPVPTAFTQVLQANIELTNVSGDKLLMHQANLFSNTTSNSVGLSALGYPQVSGVTLETVMPARPAYQWILGGPVPSTAQALVAFSKWSDTNGQWAVVVLAPPDKAAPLRLPALPGSFLAEPSTLSPRWPPPTGTAPFHNMVGLIEVGGTADYSQLRAERGLTALIRGRDLLSPTAPISSRSVISAGGVFAN